MNYKHIAIIALVFLLALASPVSAAWSNGNWITDDKKDGYFGNSEVKYDPTSGVTSKYSTPSDVNLMTYQGMVVGHLRSGGVLGGGERFLFHRVGIPENQTLAQYFGPDGQYTGYLAPGEYDVILPQGTGSACGIYSDDWGYVGNPHEERTRITVVAGYTTYFDFIGNSIPSYGGDVCNPVITVIDAQYCWDGYTVHHDDVYTYVGHHHGDYSWDDAVPAHYEIVAFGSYDGKCKAVGMWEPYDFTIGMVRYKINTAGPLKYKYHAEVPDHYEYVGHHHGDYSFTPAHDEFVSGDCVDVTTDVQSVVGSGVSSFQMIFDNAFPRKGIYAADGHTLLKEIADPSVGHVKTATIKYNTGCGSSDKTVSKEERQIISLN